MWYVLSLLTVAYFCLPGTGNAHGLGVEALRMLTQMVLSNEEELKLKYFKDDSQTRLCPVDAFLKAMLDVPFAFKRVDAMLYIASFYLEINQLRMSYATLEVMPCSLGNTTQLYWTEIASAEMIS